MNKRKLHSAAVLRFRRWSRVGYAVFCSLACSVTIGVLSVSVSDKSLLKSVSVFASSVFSTSSEANLNDQDDEVSDFVTNLLEKQEVSLIKMSFDGVAEYRTLLFYIHHNG